MVSHGSLEIGLDEVGRGSLAGPLVAAAACQNPHKHRQACELLLSAGAGAIYDSKMLTAGRRNELVQKFSGCLYVGFGFIEAPRLDHVGLQEANYIALENALYDLLDQLPKSLHSCHMKLLLDGRFVPERLGGYDAHAIVKGDQTVSIIGLASVFAKVMRDEWMQVLHAACPLYHWQDNKGYGTKAHGMQISRLGLSPFHRRSFKMKPQL